METLIDTRPPAVRTARRFDVIVIGAGQAGLATGYHLARHGLQFTILDAHDRVGDNWRKRWDSLRLFTPARYDGLPGMPYPASGHTFPTGGEMADYLETYAHRMGLPIRTGVKVDCVEQLQDRDGFVVATADGERLEANHIVVATGSFQAPNVPDLGLDLSPDILQLHSSEYRNPSQLHEGSALVVGASNSGAEIALELAASRPTLLSGRDTGQIPFRIDGWSGKIGVRIFWFMVNHVFRVSTPMGRKMRTHFVSKGQPVVRVRSSDLAAAGVQRTTARVVGTRQGKPTLEDGQVLDVKNVIWCTGFRNDFSWIDGPVTSDDGAVQHVRGVSSNVQGLYFVGLIFQSAGSSILVGGVGKDAAYIANQIAAATSSRR